jgi:hypothetical protein
MKQTSNANSDWEAHKGLLRHQLSSFKIQRCTDSDVLKEKYHTTAFLPSNEGIVWWITDMKIRHSDRVQSRIIWEE